MTLQFGIDTPAAGPIGVFRDYMLLSFRLSPDQLAVAFCVDGIREFVAFLALLTLVK